MERRLKRDLELEKKRKTLQEAYSQKLAAIQDDIDHQRLLMKMMAEEEDQKKTIAKQQEELKGLKETAARLSQVKKTQTNAASQSLQGAKGKPKAKVDENDLKGAQKTWERYKKSQGVENEFLDELMEMIGLEEVKQAFLETKAKVDTRLRQTGDLASERFNCSLLGNPGTGKCSSATRSLWMLIIANMNCPSREDDRGTTVRQISHLRRSNSGLPLRRDYGVKAGEYGRTGVSEADRWDPQQRGRCRIHRRGVPAHIREQPWRRCGARLPTPRG